MPFKAENSWKNMKACHQGAADVDGGKNGENMTEVERLKSGRFRTASIDWERFNLCSRKRLFNRVYLLLIISFEQLPLLNAVDVSLHDS